MNGRHIWLVFRKEVLDLLRDRKTWIGTLVIPIVVIPLVFFVLGTAISGVEREAKAYIPIAVQGGVDHPLVRQLEAAPGVKRIDTADPLAALKAAEVRAVIQIPPDFDRRLQSGQTADVHVLYDKSNQKSEYARDVIDDAVTAYEQRVVEQRLRAAGLSSDTVHPIQAVYESVASQEKVAGGLLSAIIPLMLILSLVSGGIPAATDLVAGEKERGTMESLVSAPVSAGSLLTAKLLAVMVMNSASAIASLISLSLVFSFAPPGEDGAVFTLGFLRPASVVMLAVMFLLLAAMFAGLEITVSTLAKSFKEAQTYMSPLVLVAMVPNYMLSPLNPADIPFAYYFLPVFNGAAVFKEIFYAELHPLHALIAVASSLIYVAIAIGLAARLFRREGLLIK